MEWLHNLSNILFPHYCLSCGGNAMSKTDYLCWECHSKLSETDFFTITDNLMASKFIGRILVQHAGSAFYFSKHNTLQRLMYQLKYHHHEQVGTYLGQLLAAELRKSVWWQEIDGIIPLPLHPTRYRERGYNQAELIANALGAQLGLPVWNDVVLRQMATITQTHKGRRDRLATMERVFRLENAEKITGKHLLLVDDVVTTGATLDFCGAELLRAADVKLSIATVGYTMH